MKRAKVKYQGVKKWVFFILVAILCWPLVTQIFPKIQGSKKLKGFQAEVRFPEWSWEKWFSGEFQSEFENYENNHIGERALFVRLDNQIDYSLYGQTNVKRVLSGSNGYLFEESYINAFNGIDFLGWDSINTLTRTYRAAQDSLAANGIQLMTVLAPGKAHFYPDEIPENLKTKRTTTNYGAFSTTLSKVPNVQILNVQSWFDSAKTTLNFPLYPKNGIHWSYAAEMMVMDSLLKRMAELQPEKAVPSISFTDTVYSTHTHFRDEDIEEAMNLILNVEDLEMAYPQWDWNSVERDLAPKVLFVADSYYWGMHNRGLTKKQLNEGEFWYYNKQIYPVPSEGSNLVADQDFYKALKQFDMVVVITTDANLKDFGFGFFQQTVQAFQNPH